jgi:prophage DNA circulation protein
MNLKQAHAQGDTLKYAHHMYGLRKVYMKILIRAGSRGASSFRSPSESFSPEPSPDSQPHTSKQLAAGSKQQAAKQQEAAGSKQQAARPASSKHAQRTTHNAQRTTCSTQLGYGFGL